MLLKLMYEPHELTLVPGKPLPGGPWLPGGPRPPGAPWRTQMRWHRIYSLQSEKVILRLLHVSLLVHKFNTIWCIYDELSLFIFFCTIYKMHFWHKMNPHNCAFKMHFPIAFPLMISFSKCGHLVLNVLVPLLPLGQQDPPNQAVLSIPYLLCLPDKIRNNKNKTIFFFKDV